jgi:hypothetical protein
MPKSKNANEPAPAVALPKSLKNAVLEDTVHVVNDVVRRELQRLFPRDVRASYCIAHLRLPPAMLVWGRDSGGPCGAGTKARPSWRITECLGFWAPRRTAATACYRLRCRVADRARLPDRGPTQCRHEGEGARPARLAIVTERSSRAGDARVPALRVTRIIHETSSRKLGFRSESRTRPEQRSEAH